MTVRRASLVAALLALAAPFVASDAVAQHRGRIDSVIVSDSRETMTEKTVFDRQTSKVYVFCMLSDAPKGTKLKAVWIAEKAEGVETNSKMTDSTRTSPGGSEWVPFSYSKPTGGWPVGTYRIEVFLDDKLEKSVTFKIVKG